jgi:hypothetical protein
LDLKLDEPGKRHIEEGLVENDGFGPLKAQKPRVYRMPEAGRIISGYLDGGRIITVSFLDFNVSEKEESVMIYELNSKDNEVVFSLSDSGIRFRCGDEMREMGLDGEVVIRNKPFEENIFAPRMGNGAGEPASSVESLYIIAKGQKTGVGIVYYKECI